MPHKLDKKQLEDFDKLYKNTIETLYLTRSEEGFQYINYLRLAFDHLTGLKWAFEYTNHNVPKLAKIQLLSMHMDAIVKGAQAYESKRDSEVLTKYHSLATYHNSVIDTIYGSLTRKFDPNEVILDTDLSLIYVSAQMTIMSLKAGISEEEKTDFLKGKISELSEKRDELLKFKIELSKVFPTFYVTPSSIT